MRPEYELAGEMRRVRPYLHDFVTFAKGRWLGREVLEVLLLHPGGFV